VTNKAMIIDGARVEGTERFDVVNPATGEVFAQVPACTRGELEQAVDAAHRAARGWAELDEDDRSQLLLAAADAVSAAAPELGRLLTQEQGKPLPAAVGEAESVAAWLRYYARTEIPSEILQDDEQALVQLRRIPIGVVAVISPWNSPLSMAGWKLAPALRAGNTVVVKPSPFTPLATLHLGAVLAGVLPPGVVNTVSGSDQLGEWLCTHPKVGKIAFTGSIRAGRQVFSAAAADMKRISLELGGNDPAIVLDDIDPAWLADKIFASAFRNSGQVCVAVKRLYVPASRHDEIVESLAARADATKVDDGLLPGTEMGPVTTEPQLLRVEALVNDALSRGARTAAGGARIDRPGYFFRPTILTGAEDGIPIVDEEQFGPALPVIVYDDEEDAIARANAGHFGLGGSVWTTDPARAGSIARQLRSGTAWINAHSALGMHMPFGGLKCSGVGVENGLLGLQGYTDVQVVYEARDAAARPAPGK
jgi:acyl-CoA reductase-like NAD-dependent aldehyde dehydrogenase